MTDRALSLAPFSAVPERNLSRVAYDLLLDKLIRQEIPAGTVLRDRWLADQLDMSRTPVRDALHRLESEGFIARAAGRTLVVKEISTRELIETLHVRQLIEAECVSLATGRIPASELDGVEEAIHSLMARPDPSAAEDWTVDCRFHTMIAENSGNAVLARLIVDLRRKTTMFNLDRVPERFAIGHREHLAVIEALRRHDREAARAGIREHIENVKLSIIRKLSTV